MQSKRFFFTMFFCLVFFQFVLAQGIQSVSVENIYDDQNMEIYIRCYSPDNNYVELHIYGPDGAEIFPSSGGTFLAYSCSALHSAPIVIRPSSSWNPFQTWKSGVYRIDVKMQNPSVSKCDPCFVTRNVAVLGTIKSIAPENEIIVPFFAIAMVLAFVFFWPSQK
ncbi:MAG: hypothetical protein N3F05_03105 [Candidatus Diapherotrites archaeon]|nr:hypothetical protein [Candidatus Diapherotrites archaeon]